MRDTSTSYMPLAATFVTNSRSTAVNGAAATTGAGGAPIRMSGAESDDITPQPDNPVALTAPGSLTVYAGLAQVPQELRRSAES